MRYFNMRYFYRLKHLFLTKTERFWEQLLRKDLPIVQRFLIGALLGVLGFAAVIFFHNKTGRIYPGVTVVTIVFGTIYGGLPLGIALIIAHGLLTNYFFVPRVLSAQEASDHFQVLIILSITTSFLVASVR